MGECSVRDDHRRWLSWPLTFHHTRTVSRFRASLQVVQYTDHRAACVPASTVRLSSASVGSPSSSFLNSSLASTSPTMSAAARRITKEYAELQADFPPHVVAQPDESNLLHWVSSRPPPFPRTLQRLTQTAGTPCADWYHLGPARLGLQG